VKEFKKLDTPTRVPPMNLTRAGSVYQTSLETRKGFDYKCEGRWHLKGVRVEIHNP
jgi:hypothetical protein